MLLGESQLHFDGSKATLGGPAVAIDHWVAKESEECMNNQRTVEIYVRLLDEGTECSRPTQALDLGNGLFKVLPSSDYDRREEVWEFPPNSIVRSEVKLLQGKEFLFAARRPTQIHRAVFGYIAV